MQPEEHDSGLEEVSLSQDAHADGWDAGDAVPWEQDPVPQQPSANGSAAKHQAAAEITQLRARLAEVETVSPSSALALVSLRA